MARDSPEFEDDNSMKVDEEEKNSNDQASNGEENGDEEEYEIEKIIEAKRGVFPNGQMAFWVKWRGYNSDENSWVAEEHIGNAKELVDEFWRKNGKKQKRKSLEPKRARKSAAADEESDEDTVAKKRSRKSTIAVDSDEDEQPVKTKPKKATTRGKAQEQPQRVHDMAKYMHKESWEDLIDTVDTVERDEGGLLVYFTLKNGETVREAGSLCRERFPKKLIEFYESNLKWRVAEANGDE